MSVIKEAMTGARVNAKSQATHRFNKRQEHSSKNRQQSTLTPNTHATHARAMVNCVFFWMLCLRQYFHYPFEQVVLQAFFCMICTIWTFKSDARWPERDGTFEVGKEPFQYV